MCGKPYKSGIHREAASAAAAKPSAAGCTARPRSADPRPTSYGPIWYQEVDPTLRRALRIRAAVAARNAGRYTWTVEYGLGPKPLESEFVTAHSGQGGDRG